MCPIMWIRLKVMAEEAAFPAGMYAFSSRMRYGSPPTIPAGVTLLIAKPEMQIRYIRGNPTAEAASFPMMSR